jgi:ABC-type branched-subunit amino acid transport system ATPase component
VTADDSLLKLESVDARYGAVQVLFGVNLQVVRGETLALLGANGAGKSTLLNVVSGLMRPAGGSISYQGSTISGLTPERRSALGIVQVIGGSGVFGPLSVADNLRAGAYRYGRREARRRIERSFDYFPVLGSRRRTKAGHLSGGQQHLLALAIALVHDPELLLVDELSLGLAPVVVEQVLDVVRALKSNGMTIVLVEQSAQLAFELADRAAFMEKGSILLEGPCEELAARSDVLQAAFLRGPQ